VGGAPEIQAMLFITIISLIVAKALTALNTQITSSQFTRITTISLIFSGLISLNCLNLETIGSGIGIYSGLFHITQISQIFEIFIYLIGGFILMGWYQPIPSVSYKGILANPRLGLGLGNTLNIKNQSDYSLIVLFSILGSSLLISSFDLISIYLSIELQSFGLYVLSTLYKDSESSTSSGLKYFLLGGLSSCIILLGIGLIYSYTGITNLESLYLLNTVTYPLASAAQAGNTGSVLEGLSLGLILIFVGFLFKIAASPLHNWSPDVYDGTPTIVTSWLTIIPKISILILLLELQIQIGSADTIIGGAAKAAFIIGNTGYLLDLSSAVANASKSLLLISSLLSLIIGSLLGLAQIRIKRLLAYSTISHIGFLLLALAINSEQSIDSFLFYIIVYTMTNLNIFLIILAFTYIISKDTRDIRYLSEFKGLFFSNPFLSLSLAVSLFSMAGIPPLIGFFSKQFVLYSALQNGYYFISILAIIVSVISASYYLKIVKLLVESPLSVATVGSVVNDTHLPAKAEVDMKVELSNVHSYLISILTVTILLFFIKPSIILNSSKLLTLSLFYI
jgi:NADH-ubiquinone oxidoreductase chain 2